MMNWLYIPVVLCAIGGLMLVFGRDWVWSIDKRSEHFQRDEHGEPIRTPEWDRNHLMMGVVMCVVAVVLAIVVALV